MTWPPTSRRSVTSNAEHGGIGRTARTRFWWHTQGFPRMREIDLAVAPRVCNTVNLEKHGTRLALFSTLTTLGTPLDVTAQELRIESYSPADRETDGWFQKAEASSAN